MYPDQSHILGVSTVAYILFVVILAVASVVFAVVIYWRIFSKAGYSGAMGLLMFVPIANIVALCILAFGEWPIYRELNQLRQRVGLIGGQPYPQNPQNNKREGATMVGSLSFVILAILEFVLDI